MAKFYTVKTGPDAERHARRELEFINHAGGLEGETCDARVIRPLGLSCSWNMSPA